MSGGDLIIPIPDELQSSPDLVEPNPFKRVWNQNTGGMIPTTVRENYKTTWNPTEQTYQDIITFISTKFPGGSSTVTKARKGMGVPITAEIYGVVDWAGRGMANIDYSIQFKIKEDGKLYTKISGRRKKEIGEILQSYLQQKLEKAKAREYGRNLRAFTSPTLRKTLNTLPNTATSQLVEFLTGKKGLPNEKRNELKAAVAKPYEGGKRKSRRRTSKKQSRRRKQTRKN